MKQFIKNNPFLTLAIVCTITISLIHFSFDVFYLFWNDILSIIFSIFLEFVVFPIAVMLILNILWVFLKKKYSKWQLLIKIFSFFVNFGIIFIQLFLFVVNISFYYMITHPDWGIYNPITDSNNYIEAKHKIGNRKETKHFPVNIPDNAKNIRLYEYYWTFKDYSAILLLKFDIDNSYIEKEIQKNKCRKLITPSIDNSEYKEIEPKLNEIRDNKYYEPSNYTFCVLNSDNSSKVGYISTYGIAFKRNQIVYYFNETNW